MSIKKLFDSIKSTNQYSDYQTEKQAYSTVESSMNASELLEKHNTFVPDVDYSNPEKFAFYGSAYLYYKGAFDRISDFYPYDGSLAEQNKFYNKLLPVEKYIFNKRYPRTTGYAILSAGGWGTSTKTDGYGLPNTLEHITFKGGPNTGSQGSKLSEQSPTEYSNRPDRSNIYDENIYETAGLPNDYGKGTRQSNLRSNFDDGVTVEFWLKTGSIDTSLTEKQVIFDLWNNETPSETNNSYGRIRLELNSATSKRLTFTVESGSTKKTSTIGPTAYDTFSDWKHYAISFQNTGSNFVTRLYVNGALNETVTTSAVVSEINSKNLMGRIGALIASPSGSAAVAGSGKLSGSIDEFRFWKVRRSSAQIAENYFDRVGGGTNTDINNTTLGVYFKFNEGITGVSATDSVVSDYSGRISNGAWAGYAAGSRNTGSAIVSASAAAAEYEDPIIRTSHPSYTSVRTDLLNKGTYYDSTNNSSFLSYAPGWVIEAHEDLSNDNLKIISHIVGSYFDRVYLLSKEIPNFKHVNYPSASASPPPFASHLPQSLGLYIPDIFVDASVQERLMNRNDERIYEQDLTETRNLIYQNLYNNLANIYKAKGTEGAFKNVLRCFNLDDDLVQLKVYSDNNIYEIKNNLKQIISKNKSVNFNVQGNFDAVVYQRADSTNPQSRGFISGSLGASAGSVENEKYYGFTAEADIIFPRYFRSKEQNINIRPIDISLYGAVQLAHPSSATHQAGTNTSTPRTGSVSRQANFQVSAVRDGPGSKNVYFKLESSGSANPFPTLTSSLFNNVYEENRWNISVRLKPKSVGLSGLVTGSALTYDLIFRGVNADLGTIKNSFEVTSSISAASGSKFLGAHKRLYAGANRNNLTGAVIAKSDVKISNVKYWTQYIENSNLDLHLYDAENSGVSGSFKNISALHTASNMVNLTNKDTLALEWNFDLLTTSDASGRFVNQDFSSGSSVIRNNYGWLGKIVGFQHTGYGNFFKTSSTDVVSIDRVNSFKFIDPEEVVSSEMISILNDDDELLGYNQTIPNYVITAEKSFYSAVSQEMLIFFAGVIDFNNLIGEPVNRYRQEYKDLGKLKESFYRRVNDVKDVEKFINYYKWFDSAISEIFSQLVPASANFIDGVQNTIESHVLERNKYKTPFPTIESKNPDPEGGLAAFAEKTYPYDTSFSPLPSSPRKTNIRGGYWKKRAERSAPEITSGDATVDAQRETIRKVINSTPTLTASRSPITVTANGSTYNHKKYALRNFSKTQQLFIDNPNSTTYKGGTNFSSDKDIDFIKAAIYPGGPVNTEGGKFVPQNILLSFVNDFQEIVDLRDRKEFPYKKTHRIVDVDYGRHHDDRDEYYHVKSTKAFPFGIISSSLTGGHQTEVQNALGLNLEIVNVHNDVYGPDMEKPLQGIFTEVNVGGNQHRHVALNTGADNNNNRPEAWRILLGACDTSKSGAIGLVGADYPMSPNYVAPAGANQPYPHANYPRAVHYRNKVVKAPINIDNIKITNTHNLGNYNNTYEIVNTVGAFSNPRQFVENQPTLPTNLFQNAATSSTQARTFLDIQPSRSYDSADRERFQFVADYSVAYLTASTNKSIIKSRFSAPGSIETSTPGYRDYRSDEFSVYNAIPFKNLSVIRPYQGPSGTLSVADGAANSAVGIRVTDIHSEDYGLRSHLARHTARFGRDSLHVRTNPGATYNELPGLHKVHRNNINTIKIASTTDPPVYALGFVGLTNEKSLLFQNETKNSTLLHTASTGASTTPETLAIAFTSSASTGFSWSGWIKFGEQGPSDEETIFAVGSRQGNVPLFRVSKTYGGSSYKIKVVIRTIANADGTTGVQGLTQWEWDMSGSNLIADWNHYALVWDPVANGQLATNNAANRAAADLYFNGAKQGEAILTVGTRAYYNNNVGGGLNVRGLASQNRLGNEFMSIGGDCQGSGATRALTASIDEFSFWTTELSTAQVGVLYNGGTPCNIVGAISASTLPAGSNLWEWLRFETGNGNSAIALNAANPGSFSATNKVVGYKGESFVPIAIAGGALALDNPTNTSLGFPLTGCVSPLIRYDKIHTYANTTKNDNFFVKHQIPRSTKQYAWVTASLVSDNGLVGFVPADFQVTASEIANSTATGYVDAYNFVTASEQGIAGNAVKIFPLDQRSANFIPQTARINTTIVEPISASSNTLGYPTSIPLSDTTEANTQYLNTDLITLVGAATTADGPAFNNLMLKRGNQYGYPSWKQVRQADHPILVNQRKRNEVQVMFNSAPKTFPMSPVSMRQKIQEIGVTDVSGKKYKFKAIHQPDYFDSKELNDLLVSPNALERMTPMQAVIVAAYRASSIKNINYIKYGEKSFPAARNEFVSHSTTRIGYANNFWHSNRDERTKLNATYNAAGYFGPEPIITGSYTRTGSFGISVSAREWPLDPQVNFLTRTAADIPAWRGASYSATANAFQGTANAPHRNPGWVGSGSAGELQNNWCSYFVPGGLYPATSSDSNTVDRYFSSDKHRATAAVPGALYARKHMLGSPQSVTNPNSVKNELASSIGGTKTDSAEANFGQGNAKNPRFDIWDTSRQADICSGEANWDAPANAGYGRRKADGSFEFISAPSVPAYDTYAKFVESIKLQSRGKALVPEYRISKNLPEYIDYGDAFIPQKSDYFEIPGTNISSSQVKFYTDYSNSEFLKHFGGVENDSKMPMTEIRLVCTASIKFHPYDGFFPAQRSVDLVEQFKNDYKGAFQTSLKDPIDLGAQEYSGEDVLDIVPGAIRPVAQAFFAPGILYNSIKSGIAVDYPILYSRDKMIVNSHYQNAIYSSSFATPPTASTAQGGAFVSAYHDYVVGLRIADTTGLNLRKLETLARSASGSLAPVNSMAIDFRPLWDDRISFETIIDPNLAANKTFADCEPHPSATLNSSVKYQAVQNKNYNLMAKNFFGAVADFYLKDSEFTNLTSETVYKDDFIFEEGEVYMARIKLRRSVTGSRDYSFESGSFMTASYNQGGGTALLPRGESSGDVAPIYNLLQYFELPQDPSKAPNFKETFTMYSRPTAFGPPLCGAKGNATASLDFFTTTSPTTKPIPAVPYSENLYISNSFGTAKGTNTILDSFTGYNWAFTPPYYNGEAWVDLIFRPQPSVTYDLERILAETSTNYLRVDPGPKISTYGAKFGLTSNISTFGDIKGAHNSVRGSQGYGLTSTFTSLIYDPQQTVQTPTGAMSQAPYAGSSINKNAMQISASLNIFGVERVLKQTSDPSGTLIETANELVGKKWVISTKFETPMLNFNDTHGLQPVTSSAGTKTLPTYGAHAAANGMWHQFGTIPTDSDTGVFMEIEDISNNWLKNHYSVRLEGSVYNNQVPDVSGSLSVPGTVGSLKDLCGFKKSKTKRRIGELKDSHTINEAIVAIPYVIESTDQNANFESTFVNFDGKYFFRLNANPSSPSEEFTKTVDMAKKYILPPQFDFLNYPEKSSPVVMFFLEFDYTFDKDDLSYMWQNLMPRNYNKGKFQTATCAQRLGNDYPLKPEDITNNKNLRWMVFKAKQRSQANYYDYHSAKAGALQIDFDDDSPLQYNWPYDFCSIVEFVEMDTEALYRNTGRMPGQNTRTAYGGSITAESKLPLVSSAQIVAPGQTSQMSLETSAPPTASPTTAASTTMSTAVPQSTPVIMPGGTSGGGSSGGSY